jgi:hypothetical protein
MTFIVVMNFYEKVGLISIPKSPVYWDKLGNDTSTQIQHWATSPDMTNLHGIFHMIGIPVSGGLALGLVRTR